MTPIAEAMIAAARQRCETASLPYAGALTPREAYSLLLEEPAAMLVDVRTTAERDWVGKVVLEERQHAAVEWNTYPEGVQNPAFLDQLGERVKPGPGQVLLFLCRSGVRSRHAATLATANGYPDCYDILEGFEGDRNAAGHRKTVGGWCVAGLPWLGA